MPYESAPTARVVRVLEVLRTQAGDGIRYSELAAAAGVSQATCHAILATLTEAGYVVRDPRTKAYALGPALLALGDAAARAFPEVRLARAELDALAAATGLQCSAAKVVDDSIAIVAAAGSAALDDPIRPGAHVPFAPPFGAIHLAWSTPHEIDAWIARAPSAAFSARALRAVVADHAGPRIAVAPYTPASARLRQSLADLVDDGVPDDVRARTVALLGAIDRLDYTAADLTSADALAVNTITAPVFDHQGRVAFAAALHLAATEVPVDRIEALGATLLAATERMTAAIDGRPPTPDREPARSRGGAR